MLHTCYHLKLRIKKKKKSHTHKHKYMISRNIHKQDYNNVNIPSDISHVSSSKVHIKIM